ncbi:hypothetical protein JHK84_052356 [Glycine max]|nr:hypothetical protein JHK85_053170 [Glycine max]KAG5082318.1 hypothetical protein JHK84_052356 [Glycine max]
MSVMYAKNEHFTYDVTSKLKTKFLGNSVDVYPVGRFHFNAKFDFDSVEEEDEEIELQQSQSAAPKRAWIVDDWDLAHLDCLDPIRLYRGYPHLPLLIEICKMRLVVCCRSAQPIMSLIILQKILNTKSRATFDS